MDFHIIVVIQFATPMVWGMDNMEKSLCFNGDHFQIVIYKYEWYK
jgi:hypothetical protein